MAMQKRLLWLLGIPGFLFIFAGASSGVYLLWDFNAMRVFSIPLALLTFGSFIIGMFLIMTALILFGISMWSSKGLSSRSEILKSQRQDATRESKMPVVKGTVRVDAESYAQLCYHLRRVLGYH